MMILRLMSTWSQGGSIHPAAGSPGVFFFGYKKTMTRRGSPGGIFKGDSKLNQSWFHPHPTLPKTNSKFKPWNPWWERKTISFPVGFFRLIFRGFCCETSKGVSAWSLHAQNLWCRCEITETRQQSDLVLLLNDWRCLHIQKIRII